MRVQQKRRLPFGRGVILLAAALLLVGMGLTGCLPDRGEGTVDTGEGSPAAARLAAEAKAKAENGTVMKAEDDAIQLEGKWTWPSLTTDYTESLEHPRIYPTERVGEGWTFTIIKKGDGYTTVSGGTVTLKGTSVTITEESGGEGDSISLTGEVKGDAIVGTVHRSVVAKTLSSGVPQGAGEYDGPWTATRVK